MSDLYTLDGDEGTTRFPLFDTEIELYSFEEAPASYVEACVRHLHALSDETITHLCEASIRYCNDFLEAIGEPQRTFASPRDVLALIEPGGMSVPEPEGEGAEPVVHLELECDWEPEHGLEWVVRGGRVIAVGPYEGHDPWAEPDPDDLYVFGGAS